MAQGRILFTWKEALKPVGLSRDNPNLLGVAVTLLEIFSTPWKTVSGTRDRRKKAFEKSTVERVERNLKRRRV